MTAPIVDVPAVVPPPETYSRARLLALIILDATTQLRNDADKTEQEDMALASRLLSMQQAIQTIVKNDPLLNDPPKIAAGTSTML
jgi:hypothetical protein